jgi:hypothetical protein
MGKQVNVTVSVMGKQVNVTVSVMGIQVIIPGLIKMSGFDWSMTSWYKTHATGW